MTTPIAHPPETLEGWYALHQIFRVNKQSVDSARLERMATGALTGLNKSRTGKRSKARTESSEGWSCMARLIGSRSDGMAIHFRESLGAIASAQDALRKTELGEVVECISSFLSGTEAGFHHVTATLGRAAGARGGQGGD